MSDAGQSHGMLSDLGALGTGLAAVVGALIAIFRYLNLTTHRDKLVAARKSFDTVTTSLASENEVDRLAGAILLRRFFDPKSEVSTKDTPYATEAVNVIAAILRGQPTGNFQKLLADGLAFAPSLTGADLQRTNLNNAYLGARDLGAGDKRKVDLRKADFFRADLTEASLKESDAQEAVFYQARLTNAVLREAKLRKANFVQADLYGANLNSANLAHADFRRAGLRRARFVRADLAKASLTESDAREAILSQARLKEAVLRNADLRGANFFEADLDGANFAGAKLTGADFKAARNLPPEFEAHLQDNRWNGPEVFSPSSPEGAEASAFSVYLSKPGCLDPRQEKIVELIKTWLAANDLETVTTERSEYPRTSALGEIRRRISGCAGMIVFGFAELTVSHGLWRWHTKEKAQISGEAFPTSWVQIEAGMASMIDMPLLLIADDNVARGVFDPLLSEHNIDRMAMPLDRTSPGWRNWLMAVRQRP
jgi:uncharacterized protein YjbI with pentapeptide repeats